MTGATAKGLLEKAARSRRLARDTTDRKTSDALNAFAQELEAEATMLTAKSLPDQHPPTNAQPSASTNMVATR